MRMCVGRAPGRRVAGLGRVRADATAAARPGLCVPAILRPPAAPRAAASRRPLPLQSGANRPTPGPAAQDSTHYERTQRLLERFDPDYQPPTPRQRPGAPPAPGADGTPAAAHAGGRGAALEGALTGGTAGGTPVTARGGGGGGGRRRQSAGLPGLGGLGGRMADVLPALDRLATSLIGDNPALTEGFSCAPRPPAAGGSPARHGLTQSPLTHQLRASPILRGGAGGGKQAAVNTLPVSCMDRLLGGRPQGSAGARAWAGRAARREAEALRSQLLAAEARARELAAENAALRHRLGLGPPPEEEPAAALASKSLPSSPGGFASRLGARAGRREHFRDDSGLPGPSGGGAGAGGAPAAGGGAGAAGWGAGVPLALRPLLDAARDALQPAPGAQAGPTMPAVEEGDAGSQAPGDAGELAAGQAVAGRAAPPDGIRDGQGGGRSGEGGGELSVPRTEPRQDAAQHLGAGGTAVAAAAASPDGAAPAAAGA